MGHTYTRLLYHLIWGTHGRNRWIGEQTQHELYAYMASLVQKVNGVPYVINGMSDHIHIVCQLRPKPDVSRVVQDVKAYSSGWFKRRFDIPAFTWQEGYGAFTVSPSQLDSVIEYAERQKEHHAKHTFETEYLGFLRAHQVEFDEKTVFD
jgi:putative transposase